LRKERGITFGALAGKAVKWKERRGRRSSEPVNYPVSGRDFKIGKKKANGRQGGRCCNQVGKSKSKTKLVLARRAGRKWDIEGFSES